MTKLLDQAIAKVCHLPDTEQDAIAQIILAEIEGVRQWEERLSKPSEKLSKLAAKAWTEHETGQSETLDPDKL